jgi:hypothetical protein
VHPPPDRWLDVDTLALDTVLTEAIADPTGVPGLLFTRCDFTAHLRVQVAPDMRDQLRATLLPDPVGGEAT